MRGIYVLWAFTLALLVLLWWAAWRRWRRAQLVTSDPERRLPSGPHVPVLYGGTTGVTYADVASRGEIS